MPAGCVQCAPGEWQCGSDTTELCAGSGGWTPAGALCLQLFVRKDPKTGNCLVRVTLHPQAHCGGPESVSLKLPGVTEYVGSKVAMKRKRVTTKKK